MRVLVTRKEIRLDLRGTSCPAHSWWSIYGGFFHSLDRAAKKACFGKTEDLGSTESRSLPNNLLIIVAGINWPPMCQAELLHVCLIKSLQFKMRQWRHRPSCTTGRSQKQGLTPGLADINLCSLYQMLCSSSPLPCPHEEESRLDGARV